MQRKRFYHHLYFWVLIGTLLGIAVGLAFPEPKPGSENVNAFSGTAFKPLSDGFIKLIRMVIAPIIFTTVVVGMAGMGNLKRIGRIGAKAFIYFEIMTTLALFIGWTVGKVFQPGAGMNIDPTRLDTTALQSK